MNAAKLPPERFNAPSEMPLSGAFETDTRETGTTLCQRDHIRRTPAGLVRSVRVVAAALCAALSSCSLTPQEQIHGRWYNADMSVRFRPDGAVLFNSRAGRAMGRYVYETSAPAAADQTTTNLVLDVVRNGEPLRLEFDARLLSRDRLRLQASPRRSAGRARDGIAATVVLRRATESDVDTAVEQDVAATEVSVAR